MKLSPNTGTLLLRVAMSLVFLWFGTNQIINPSEWIGFLPGVASKLPLAPESLIRINGFFEVIFGALLILGIYTRIVALLLAFHLSGIVLTLGFTAIGVRDFGLAIATLSLFFLGPDSFTLDEQFARKKQAENFET